MVPLPSARGLKPSHCLLASPLQGYLGIQHHITIEHKCRLCVRCGLVPCKDLLRPSESIKSAAMVSRSDHGAEIAESSCQIPDDALEVALAKHRAIKEGRTSREHWPSRCFALAYSPTRKSGLWAGFSSWSILSRHCLQVRLEVAIAHESFRLFTGYVAATTVRHQADTTAEASVRGSQLE